jgi:predicted acyl esterase
MSGGCDTLFSMSGELDRKESAASVPAYGIIVEKDVDVPMRDGARLKADVLRPDDAGRFPAILNVGPYQKDKLWIPPDSLEEKPNPLMNWETVNPQWWVPRGYAAVRIDGRGSGKSPGQCEPWSLAESIDFYDAIEWAAAQAWCSGKVGLCGISYFMHYHADYNTGTNTIHAGGDRESYLLLPVIPPTL